MRIVLVLAMSSLLPGTRAHAQLHWPDPPKKAPLHVRLVAVALSDPRSSFFSSHEVIIAEREIAHEEWSLVKLVYTFLPYQPRLSEVGFDYSVVHELSATRDPNCDETVAQLTSVDLPANGAITLRYSPGAAVGDLAGRRIPLPCYETTADDYTKSWRDPVPPPPSLPPSLATRTR